MRGSGLAAAVAAAVAALALGVALGAPNRAPSAAEESARRYPASKAAEFKARLLERPSAPEVSSWAVQYLAQPELDRLEPVARAAEKIWAARLGLAASRGAEKAKLRAVLASLEGCPIDSLALRRAATGLARIGIIVPLSGRFDRYGKTFVQGLRLAVDEHNREWAPNLTLILHDSEGDPLVGARKARWLLRDHGVSVLIGELFSTNTAPLAAASQVVGAVLISPSATNERLATLGDAVFQLHLGNTAMAQALARYLAQENSSIAVLASETPEDSARVLALEAACRAAGVDVVGKETVPESAVDLLKSLGSLRAKHSAALALITTAKLAGIAAAQLPTAWPDAHVVGFNTLDPEGMNAEARAALEGATYVASDYVLLGAVRDSFETRYQRACGEAPTRMSVRGYLVGVAVTRAIERGSLNASMLREALRAQLYDTDEGRVFRALKPLVAAEPERFQVKGGRAVSVAPQVSP